MDLIPAVLQGSVDAIQRYQKMSSEMWAPEGYIRDICAVYIHEKFGVPVSTEVSCNYFKALWGVGVRRIHTVVQ